METKGSIKDASPTFKQQEQYWDEAKKIPKTIIQGRFELKAELGAGAHGKIFLGKDKHLKQNMEKISKNKSKFQREISLMKDVAKVTSIGFPKLIQYASDKYYYYIIMEQLGPNLKELKDQLPEKRFSVKTVTMIGLQLLQRLEVLHNLNYVHRDLKPANILNGRSKSDQGKIYLIDYGLAKKQVSVQANLPHEVINKVVGTAIYAALSAHMPGQQYEKKDDLESMMYVLAYLHIGTLPWKNCKNNEQGLEKMMKVKMVCSSQELFGNMPKEYSLIFEHIRSTPPDSLCDYQYIEGLFKSISYQMKFKLDNMFDWIVFKRNSVNIQSNSENNLDYKNAQLDQQRSHNFNKSLFKDELSHNPGTKLNTSNFGDEDPKSPGMEMLENQIKVNSAHHIDQGGTALNMIQELVEEEKVESPIKKKTKVQRKNSRKSKKLNDEQRKKLDINLTLNMGNGEKQQKNSNDNKNKKNNSIHLHLHINHKDDKEEDQEKSPSKSQEFVNHPVSISSQGTPPLEESKSFLEFQLGIKNEFGSTINKETDENQINENINQIKREMRVHSNEQIMKKRKGKVKD